MKLLLSLILLAASTLAADAKFQLQSGAAPLAGQCAVAVGPENEVDLGKVWTQVLPGGKRQFYVCTFVTPSSLGWMPVATTGSVPATCSGSEIHMSQAVLQCVAGKWIEIFRIKL